jgi:uncharacterized protein
MMKLSIHRNFLYLNSPLLSLHQPLQNYPSVWYSHHMNKQLTFLLSLIFLFLFSGSVYGDDYQDGADAYDRKDYKTAYKLWLPLAEQGDALAQYNLGQMYRNGQGVPQDDKEAVKWYRLSAEQFYALAQVNLGFMYSEGKGVPQDYKEAVKWYRLSAEQGVAEAQYNLGNMYREGQGVPQNYKEAVRLYRLSAEQGDAGGQLNLGFMYDKGLGVLQDYALAHMWFNLSGSNGNKQAVTNRDIIEKRMSPTQIEKAQELARNWTPKK